MYYQEECNIRFEKNRYDCFLPNLFINEHKISSPIYVCFVGVFAVLQ